MQVYKKQNFKPRIEHNSNIYLICLLVDRNKYEKESHVKKYFVLTRAGQGLSNEWQKFTKSPFMKVLIINLKNLEEKQE